jgi:PAS domain S-box-containing protein
MRSGVSDLVLKSNLSRLAPAIRREVAAAEQQTGKRRSEQRFRDIVALSGDWIWETDAGHRLAYFSERSLEAEWADPFRSLGKTIWEVIGADPDTDPAWRRHKGDLDARREFRDFRITFTSPSGSRNHVSTSGVPIHDRNGAFVGYRGTVTDETVMVEAFWRAEQAEAVLSDALGSISEGLVIADAAGRIVSVNDAYAAMFPELGRMARRGGTFTDLLRAASALGLHLDQAEACGRRVSQLANGRRIMTTGRRMQNGGLVSLWMDVSAAAGEGVPAQMQAGPDALRESGPHAGRAAAAE